MSDVVVVFLSAVASLNTLMVGVLAIEVFAAILRRPAKVRATSGERGRVAIIVPAHNEGMGIRFTIEDLKGQLLPEDRLLVVADNCTDETALVAGSLGAEVIERHDPTRRGKGYALDFGIRNLRQNPPDFVVIVDADCRVAAGHIDEIARLCSRTKRPVQALDLMIAPEGLFDQYRWPTFAWRVRNWVRPLGLHNLGLPCQLMGTGMAFPWFVLDTANLANGDLVEDRKLGLELAKAGFAPVFCESALVVSRFPTTADAAAKQRERWEVGNIATMARSTIPLLFASVCTRDLNLLVLMLDLLVPPLSVLAFCGAITVVLSGAAALVGISHLPLAISSISTGVFYFTIFLAWMMWGRDLLPARSAVRTLGSFLQAKLRLYAVLLQGRMSSEWIRTDRDRSM